MSETVTCVECGAVEELRWVDSRNDKLRSRSACFSCCFWLDRIDDQATDPRLCIVGGYAYAASPRDDRAQRANLGFGGAEFRFEFFDGRVVETNNAYGQGPVPDRFRDRLPDTARLGHVCGGDERKHRSRCPRSLQEEASP